MLENDLQHPSTNQQLDADLESRFTALENYIKGVESRVNELQSSK